MTRNTRKAFTLMELMTVVVIVGIIASFAIPNYQRTIERAHQRDADTNLMSIHAANQIYRAENSVFWPGMANPGNQNLAQINQNLRLSIIGNGMTYLCSSATNNDFTCTATRIGGTGFIVTVNQNPINPTVNPGCSGGCP